MKLRVEIERWPYKSPFRITGFSWDEIPVLVVTLEEGSCLGRGEAAGVHYLGDDIPSMLNQIESVRSVIEAGISGVDLQGVMPPGGARNAVDCALWDLDAKLNKQCVWQLAELKAPRPLLTSLTCVVDDPGRMAASAHAYAYARAIKLKLSGEPIDADRVRAVREAKPDVWLGVDANQGFSRPFLEKLLPVLIAASVSLIEQPFRRGEEFLLDGFRSPIPIAADESVQDCSGIGPLVGRFNVVNIKLDKCGGLTEALAMARMAREVGLVPMVGCMGGTSLAMAPGFVVGQLCDLVDLDGPMFLKRDRAMGVQYQDGLIECSNSVWGNAS